MTPSGALLDSDDGVATAEPQPPATSRTWLILAVVTLSFLIWAAFMGWMAALYANPWYVNEAQLLNADLIVLAKVGKGTGEPHPVYPVTVAETLKAPADGKSPQVTEVEGPEGLTEGESYFLAVEELPNGRFQVVRAPFGGDSTDVRLDMNERTGHVVPSDVEYFGTQMVYPDEPGVRAQIEALLKEETPAAKP